MALSRLRQPVIYRAPALLRASLLHSSITSSSRSISRTSGSKDTYDDIGSRLRSISLSNCHGSISKQLQNGFRYMSSESTSHTAVQMPALSPTMSQGNIAKWLKKEGDKIEVGDVLCEIETDKATLEFESLEEGYLAMILMPEGSKDVQVGQPIAVTVEDAKDIQNVAASVGSGSIFEKSALKATKNEDNGEQTGYVTDGASDHLPHVVVEMPALSPTMNQGNIAKWRKKEGEKINVGDVICEIETDKATLEFESLEEGYLAKILAPEGSKNVAVGQPIAVTVEDLADLDAVVTSFASSLKKRTEKMAVSESKAVEKDVKGGTKRISPSAKILIAELGLDPSSLEASGPHGTLLKGDVLAALKSRTVAYKEKISWSSQAQWKPEPSVSPQSSPHLPLSDLYEDLPNSQIRKVIAQRLLESKQHTPHLYLSLDVILDPLLSFRNELIERHNVKVSVNDIVIKAVAVALRNVPAANGYWSKEEGEIVLNQSVDISIAVATEKGLMTPIVRNADQKMISEISSEVKELAEKARSGKLKPEEFQGGTFSISNLGMFPVDHFCAIINPPQAGILAVGRGNKVVELVVDGEGIEKPWVVTKMNLTLSADHRVFDGQVGGEFLSALRSNFSNIQRLLL